MSACTEIQCTIFKNGAERAAALDEFEAAIGALPTRGFVEIWIDHDAFPALCGLINGDVGWLMWIRYDGDAGFSSRNLAYSGPPNAEIAFMLGNGQVDRHPAAWAYPRAEVLRALESFARNQRVDNISWFNDSGDGSATPEGTQQPKRYPD